MFHRETWKCCFSSHFTYVFPSVNLRKSPPVRHPCASSPRCFLSPALPTLFVVFNSILFHEFRKVQHISHLANSKIENCFFCRKTLAYLWCAAVFLLHQFEPNWSEKWALEHVSMMRTTRNKWIWPNVDPDPLDFNFGSSPIVRLQPGLISVSDLWWRG